MKLRMLLAVLLVVSVVVVMPVLGQIPADTLVIGMNHDPIIDFAPERVYELEDMFILEQVYDQLVNFTGGEDAFKEVKPGLAESWEVSEDGLTWTFHVRQGVRFHSGNEVNADAVVFSFQRALDRHQAPIWIMEQFVPTKDMIQRVDDYTVSITTKAPIGEMLFAAAFGYQGIGCVLDPAVIQEHATGDDPLAAKWVAEHDAGSGPFTIAEWVKRDRIVLTAFDDYWQGAPQLRRIIIKDLPEPTAQKLALERGDIDVAWNLLPEMIVELRSKEGIRVVESSSSFSYHYLAMNFGCEPLSHIEVRQAIRWALDYNAITDGIMAGSAVKNQSIVPVGMFSHLDLSYAQNLDKARELMAKAGYAGGFDVELITRTDQPFTDIAAQIQQDLKKINIRVKITTMVWAEVLKVFRARTHQLLLARGSLDYADPSGAATMMAHCRVLGDDAEVKQMAWRCMYCPSGLADWVEEAAAEQDPRRREVLYKAIQALVLEEGPFVMLHNTLTQVATRETVVGLEIPAMWPYTELRGVSKTQ
ncbi:MAG: ABC transporter substrate-binding protein [Thermotogota bacterium]